MDAGQADAPVVFNVCGRRFATTRDTIQRYKPHASASTYLTALADPYWSGRTGPSTSTALSGEPQASTIDRSPVLFEAVLDFLRYGRWRIPPGVSAFDVFDEFDFYGYAVPASSTTLAWHRQRKEAAASLATLDTALPSPAARARLEALLCRCFEEDAPVLLLPSPHVVEQQLGDFGLPALKVKLAELMTSPHRFRPSSSSSSTPRGANPPPTVVDDELFEFAKDPAHGSAIKHLAATAVHGSVVKVKLLSVSVTVGAGSYSSHAPLDYTLTLSNVRLPEATANARAPSPPPSSAAAAAMRPKVSAVEICPVEVSPEPTAVPSA
eukprot:CAMPEP_0174833634 /NCGR_PEP_ID=MMETSP1114-20130205/4357_1 /TAXON_ID=312471 /ORGANISM="Neobodo designis, Strain CCAP 1951/1" /LENGTH=323 /DNA_ID=CAMNT_0016067525 /DNA_START=98 /DNA_END=1069 /DNA_ORIENTATION=+